METDFLNGRGVHCELIRHIKISFLLLCLFSGRRSSVWRNQPCTHIQRRSLSTVQKLKRMEPQQLLLAHQRYKIIFFQRAAIYLNLFFQSAPLEDTGACFGMVFYGGGILKMTVFEMNAFKLFSCTPRHLVFRLIPMIYTQEALEQCAIGSSEKIPLYEKGIDCICGEQFLFFICHTFLLVCVD